MAISQEHCRTSAPEDDDRAVAVIPPMTASVVPLAGNIPSTPPRNKQVFGLITPLATPDSLLRLNSSEFRFTSPSFTPTRRPNVPKDTTPLTVSGNPSKCDSDKSTVVAFLPPAGLLTPDSTPPRLSKPRFIPISHKEETEDNLKLILPLKITSTVVKISETSEHHTEVVQNTRKSEPDKAQCIGITKKTKRQCFKSVKAPNRYCIYHVDQDTDPPPNLSVTVRAPQRRQSKDISITPTTNTSSQCHGLTLRGVQCRRSVKGPAPYCHQHEYQSNNTPTAPIAPQLTIAVNSRCHGLTLRGIQCQRSIKPPAQYCFQHESQRTYTPTTPTAPKPKSTTVVNSQCRGLTLRGVQCRRSVKFPVQYCFHHEHQSNNTPTAPIAPQPTIEGKSRCHGRTQDGIQCQRPIKSSAQYCYQHGPQRANSPTVPTTSAAQKTVQCNAKSNSKGRRCQQRVLITPGQLTRDASQPIYCRSHHPDSVGIVTHVDNKGFKVQLVGQEEIFVYFFDYIPEYLQPETQQKLRKAITGNISAKLRIPGYVYALNVFDSKNKEKLSLKVGFSKDVKKRHAEWKKTCRSSIRDIRGWWPQTIIEDKDDDEISIQKLIGDNRQGTKGPMAEQLERLVHIELKDLATHAPYLHPNFPDIHFSDIPRLPEVATKPCPDCNGTKHQEVFSFTRVKEGEFFGREWEDIVKPVIRKWGLFLMKYFSQDRMSSAF